MKRSRRSQLLQFSKDTMRTIWERERGACFFCKNGYHVPLDWKLYKFDMEILDIMHFVPKSAGGLGVKENGVLGCRMHHNLLDNGNKGVRQEMLDLMEAYLKSKYKDWNREKITYRKGMEYEDN